VRFQPGESGNPGGKARGTRNRVTLAAEALLAGETEALTRKAIELALAGDIMALRLCLDRIMPARRGGRVCFHLPALNTAADLPRALAAVAGKIADGTLSPEEGAAVASLLEAQRRAIELTEIEARLRALEERAADEVSA
jgi:hypothetical protein